jgi:hypothetical protein
VQKVAVRLGPNGRREQRGEEDPSAEGGSVVKRAQVQSVSAACRAYSLSLVIALPYPPSLPSSSASPTLHFIPPLCFALLFLRAPFLTSRLTFRLHPSLVCCPSAVCPPPSPVLFFTGLFLCRAAPILLRRAQW